MQLNFEVAKANAWSRKVESEFQEIDRLLSQVTECIQTNKAEEDPIIKTIYDVGTEMQGKWSELKTGFDSAISCFNEIGSIISSGIEDSVEKVSSFLANFHI